MTPRGAVAAAVAVGLLAAACGDDGGDEDRENESSAFEVVGTVELDGEAEPVALAVTAEGELLVGERLTGRVRTVTDDLELRDDPSVQVDVAASPSDQRGFLGLAVDGDQGDEGARVYGAWTRAADGRIVVAELIEGDSVRLVWEGPVSAERANGGHLDLLPDGRLVVGVGDLLEPNRVADPDAPNGKLLALDPEAGPEQRPAVLSGGWNNPFAFVVGSDGALWVADNAPGDDPERIGRGDVDAEPTDLPGKRAPSALIELAPGQLGLCGYLDGELVTVDVTDDAEIEIGERVATDCRTGAVVLPDGRIAASDGSTVHILEPRG